MTIVEKHFGAVSMKRKDMKNVFDLSFYEKDIGNFDDIDE